MADKKVMAPLLFLPFFSTSSTKKTGDADNFRTPRYISIFHS